MAAAGVALVLAAVWFLRGRRRRQRGESTAEVQMEMLPDGDASTRAKDHGGTELPEPARLPAPIVAPIVAGDLNDGHAGRQMQTL